MELFLYLLLPIAVVYFFLVRPQAKQRREIAEVQSTITTGTRVMTSAGLIGTIVAIEGDEVLIEVAPGVNNRYVRRAIMRVLDDARPDQAADEPATRPIDDTTPGTTA